MHTVKVMLGDKVLTKYVASRPAAAFAEGFNRGCSQAFLLWDNTPQEKGEAPELVDLYVTQERAEEDAAKLAEEIDPDTDWREFYSVERRETKI
jgi:hypothetical protein